MLLVLLVHIARCKQINSTSDCLEEKNEGYSSRNGCLLKRVLQAGPLRVAFLDTQHSVQNNAAMAKMKFLNQDYIFYETCDSKDSIAEW
jgi:hypothetical protein